MGITSHTGKSQGLNLESKSDTVEKNVNPADVIIWSPQSAMMDKSGTITFPINLETRDGFTVYVDKLKWLPSSELTLVNVEAPATQSIYDEIERKNVDVYAAGTFTVTLKSKGPSFTNQFRLKVEAVGCTGRICLFPYTKEITFKTIAATGDVNAKSATTEPAKTPSEVVKDATTYKESNADEPNITAASDAGPLEEDFESKWARQLKAGTIPFEILLVIVFVSGLLTNLTPCVFPMIPITIRLLGRQGHSPIASSAVYASGILVMYTSLGVFAALSGSMFGGMLASTTFNVVFAGLMFFMGLTMLGFGNLAALQNFGNRLGGSGKASFKNTFLMGTGAGLVASPCTGPILAALLAYTAKANDITQSVLLLFIYSLGFALPYVFLGGMAGHLGKIKVSNHIQVGTKVFFGSIMFALGFYYLRIPLHQVLQQLSSAWGFLAAVSLGVGTVGALMWIYMPSITNLKSLAIAPTAVLGFGLFAWQQQLTLAVLPEGQEIVWLHTEAEAYAQATSRNMPIFIDAWAEWCEACKKMDRTTYREARVYNQLTKNFILLKLDLTEGTDANDALTEKYGLQSLPTMVMLPPNGDLTRKRSILGYAYAGALLNSTEEFLQELKAKP